MCAHGGYVREDGGVHLQTGRREAYTGYIHHPPYPGRHILGYTPSQDPLWEAYPGIYSSQDFFWEAYTGLYTPLRTPLRVYKPGYISPQGPKEGGITVRIASPGP